MTCRCHGDVNAHIQEIVDRAPPLTDEQRDRLTVTLRMATRRVDVAPVVRGKLAAVRE